MAHICYSCISPVVAPSNLILIALIGMKAYNSPLKFKSDR